jgi:hypothetical protein
MRTKFIFKVILLLQAACVFACSSDPSLEPSPTPEIPPLDTPGLSPSPTPEVPSLAACGENVYSREEEKDILEEYFEHVSLFDWRTDEGIAQDRNGNHLLTTDQYLAVNYESAFPNHMRVCIQEFNKAGKVVFDNTVNTAGQGTWPLRPLEAGRYVIRVIVKNMVIESLMVNVAESPSPPLEAGADSDKPGVEITSLNEEWNRYVNRTLGFAIDTPKMMYRYPAECAWEQTGAGTQLVLEGGIVPVAVIQGSDRVYITSKTIIALSSSKEDPQDNTPHSYDICEKKETTLDGLQKSENTSFLWEIAFKTVETEEDLEELVDSYYGPCFSVGDIKPVEDEEYFTVQVLGDQKPVEESTCLLRGMYIFLYSPDLNNAATWKTGTMVHFSATGPNQDPYDGAMYNSFQFIPRIQED